MTRKPKSTPAPRQKSTPAPRQLKARGMSMFPLVWPGARLEIAEIARIEPRIGDIVCFPGTDGQVVAHRLVAITGTGAQRRYEIRGDALAQSEWVPASAIAFVVRRVSGRLGSYHVDSKLGRALAHIAVHQDWRYRTLSAVCRAAARRMAR